MSVSRAILLLLVAATWAGAVAVPHASPESRNPKTPGQSIESLFPAVLAKLESHDLQLQQLRAENGELRKSFGEVRRNCSRVEEELRTVQAEAASLVRVDRRRKLPDTFYEPEWEAREEPGRAEREAARGRKWQARFDALEQQVALLLAELARRKLQSNGPASQGEFVSIFKRSFSRGHLSATTDPNALASPGGHRRWLQELLGCDLSQRSALINTECCAVADCSGDKLRACDERCAAVLLPFWAECSGKIPAATAEVFREAVDLWPALPGATSSAVREFQVVCPPGVVADDCIPKCDASINGDLLLLNMEGDDTKVNTRRDQCKHPA